MGRSRCKFTFCCVTPSNKQQLLKHTQHRVTTTMQESKRFWTHRKTEQSKTEWIQTLPSTRTEGLRPGFGYVPRQKVQPVSQSYQRNQAVFWSREDTTAYLECSYLDSGTLDVRLVLRGRVFCSALRVTSRRPPHHRKAPRQTCTVERRDALAGRRSFGRGAGRRLKARCERRRVSRRRWHHWRRQRRRRRRRFSDWKKCAYVEQPRSQGEGVQDANSRHYNNELNFSILPRASSLPTGSEDIFHVGRATDRKQEEPNSQIPTHERLILKYPEEYHNQTTTTTCGLQLDTQMTHSACVEFNFFFQASSSISISKWEHLNSSCFVLNQENQTKYNQSRYLNT